MTAALVILGGLLALDQTSLGQFMASRPLVAGVVAGLVVGDPWLGLAVGGFLEVLFLPAFPVGGGSFPETGPATVVGVAAASGGGAVGGLAVGVLFGTAWALLGELTIRLLRRLNGRIAPEPTGGRMSPASLAGRHLAALSMDGLRGAALTWFGVALATRVGPALGSLWLLDRGETVGFLGGVAALTLGGLAVCYIGRRGRIAALLGGLAAGGAVGVML